ncbi:MAG: FHA domain-containing protein [Planctomycetota bacterium]
MASLLVVSGPNEGDYYPLGKRTTVLGRDEGVPIQITDELVSRKHVQIRFDAGDESFHAIDMKSANGTLINGRTIGADVTLVDGDIIEIGKSKVMFSTQNFEDRESAMANYHKRGERGKSTLIR